MEILRLFRRWLHFLYFFLSLWVLVFLTLTEFLPEHSELNSQIFPLFSLEFNFYFEDKHMKECIDGMEILH